MRTAELVTAACMMAVSLSFMIGATALPIGWVHDQGPGGGAFPFWLSAMMLAASAAIALRELRPAARRAQRAVTFIAPAARGLIFIVTLELLATIALTGFLGVYVAVPLFLMVHLRLVGRQGWGVCVALAAAAPVAMFLFFEAALRILLPKGVTEPLFVPLYAFFF